MITVHNAKQSDIDYVLENPIHDAFKDYPRDLSGNAKTAVLDGDIIGVGGVVIIWPGVAEVWLLLTKHAADKPVEMSLAIRRVMNALIEDHDLRRLNACVRLDFPRAQKLLEHLGFEYEGYKQKYLPDGTDALMYGLVKE